MTKLKSATLVWPARVGAVALVAAAGLVSVPEVSQAAAATATATPSTGAAGNTISINAPANTFKTSTGTLKIANTSGTIASNAIQFTTAACPTTAQVVPTVSRTVTDAAVATSTTLTSATAGFNAADVGRVVAGAGIPAGDTIASVTNATTAVLATAGTAAASNVTVSIGVRKVADLVTTSGSTTVTSATAVFSAADVGKVIASANITAGTTIASVTNATTAVLSAAANTTGTAQTASIATLTQPYAATAANTTVVSGSKIVTRAPANMATVAAGTTYNICIWDAGVGAAATVLATASYKVFPAPTITDVSLSSGAAQGGDIITVTGTNVTAAAKVTIGGTPLDNPTVSATNGTVTGNVPAHAAGAAPIVLSTEGGPVTYGTNFTYYDGLSVTPTKTLPTASNVLDIYGSGFTDPTISFGDYAPTSLGTVALATNDVVTVGSVETLAVGDRVKFGTITSAVGVTAGVTYWVKTAPSTTTLTLSLTKGGPTVDITTAGTGASIFDVTRQNRVQLGAATLTTSTNVVSWTGAHGLAVGDVVVFTGAITTTTTIAADTAYYVLTVPSSTSVTLSATKGGAVLAIDATGTSDGSYRGDSNTHVVLALGTYDPTAAAGTPGAPVAECTGVNVLGPTELICQLTSPNLQDGSYQVVLVDNEQSGTDRATIASSTSAFTSASY